MLSSPKAEYGNAFSGQFHGGSAFFLNESNHRPE